MARFSKNSMLEALRARAVHADLAFEKVTGKPFDHTNGYSQVVGLGEEANRCYERCNLLRELFTDIDSGEI